MKNRVKKEMNKLGILPNSRESEIGILSCLLLDPNLISTCISADLKPQDFYDNRNAIIYATILKLHKEGVTPDFLSLTTALKDYEEKIPPVYIMEIIDYLPAPMNLNFFIERVKNLSRIRHYITVAKKIQLLGYETENPDELEKAISDILFEQKEDAKIDTYKPVTELLEKEIETYETFAHGAKVQQRAIWGILGATSAGKSEYSLDLALSFASQDPNNIVLFCEYEGTEEDLTIRIQRKAVNEPKWQNDRIFISMKTSFLKIVNFVRRHSNSNILIIIDYLQRFARLLQSTDERQSDNLRLYVNNIYNSFDKLRADHTNVSVCLLMSMSKQGISEVSKQKRADKVDLLNAIKESGDVQYDLDYAYAMLFSENINDDSLSLSRFGSSGKVKRYMHLYPIKEARIGEPLRESVFTFSGERYAYEMVEMDKDTATDSNTIKQIRDGFDVF